MKKSIITATAILALLSLTACSKNMSKNSSQKYSSTVKSDQISQKSSTSTQKNDSTTSSNEKNTTTSATDSLFAGYSTEQVEYARVTETLLHYYGQDFQPVSVTVTKNGTNHPVFPYSGSVRVSKATVTLIFSSDNTMARTWITTYSSNGNGSINFYKDPNHYQDERYLTDPAWVKEESQKLLASTQMLEIPTTFDEKAAQIIHLIQIKDK